MPLFFRAEPSLLSFHILLCKNDFIPLIILHSLHQDDKAETKIQTILQIYQSGIITFRHFTLYFDEALLEGNTASSLLGYDATDFVGLNLGIFLAFLSADPLKLCQFGLGLCVNVHFHIST